MDAPFCKICKQTFDFAEHKHILLPCGHSLCEACLKKFLYAEISLFCPFDGRFAILSQCRTNNSLFTIPFKPITKSNNSAEPPQNASISARIHIKYESMNSENLKNRDSLDENVRIKKDQSFYNSSTPDHSQNLSMQKVKGNKEEFINLSINNKKEMIKESAEGKPRRKRRKRKFKRKKTGNKQSNDVSLIKICIVSVSIIGGIYLLARWKAKLSSHEILNGIKKPSMSLLQYSKFNKF